MRIRMLRDRLFKVPTNRRKAYAYKANHGYTVKREWGETLIADGDALEAPTPPAPTRASRRKAPRAV